MGSPSHSRNVPGSPSSQKSCFQKSIDPFLEYVSKIEDEREKIVILEGYIDRLEDEKKKIEAFKSVLPLCMSHLKQAIAATKNEITLCNEHNSKKEDEKKERLERMKNTQLWNANRYISNSDSADADEMMMGEDDWLQDDWLHGEVMEETFSLKKISRNGYRHEEQWMRNSNSGDNSRNESSSKTDTDKRKKMGEDDLLQSAKNKRFDSYKSALMATNEPTQCNEYNSEPVLEDSFPLKKISSNELSSKTDTDKRKIVGEDDLLQSAKNKRLETSRSAVMTMGVTAKDWTAAVNRVGYSYNHWGFSPATSNLRVNLQTGKKKKQKEFWPLELHSQFRNAIEHLGGLEAAAATPKKIRELMQWDGLTVDEVGSHLQMYRIHMQTIAPNVID